MTERPAAPARGRDLGRHLRERGPLSREETVRVLFGVARALEPLHSRGVAHRDLRPESILADPAEEPRPDVRLLEAGSTEIGAGAETKKARLLSAPLYLAPEQVRGDEETGPRTDVYAIGHVAYALLAGEPYFLEEREANDAAFHLLGRIVAGAAEPASARAERRRKVELPPAFNVWFTRAAAPEAKDRFESATLAVEALARALEIEPEPRPTPAPARTSAPAAMPVAAPAKPQRRSLGPVLAGGVLLALLAVIAWQKLGTKPGGGPQVAASTSAGIAASLNTGPAATATATASPSVTASVEPQNTATATASAAPSTIPLNTAQPLPSATPSASSSATALNTAQPKTGSAAPSAGLDACVRAILPADTFDEGVTPDFGFVCTEADPRRGAAQLKGAVVRGSSKTFTEGKLQWGVLGFYEMPAFAVVHTRCCTEPKELKLPPMAGTCALAERLAELVSATLAATAADDPKVRAAAEQFGKSVSCVQRSEAFADLFPWKEKLAGGEQPAFLKLASRLAQNR